MTFASLGLMPQLLQAITDEGYQQPSPIQAQAIPPLLAGRDLIGISQTGTGKTAAFALPILQTLANDTTRHGGRRPIRALVLTPTRELASQVAMSFTTYGSHLRLSCVTLYGGVGAQPQIAALRRGVDIVVACPGRLLDLMNQGHVDLQRVQALVLDEADRMFDMGFLPDLRRIINRLPKQRQNLLFSATMPKEIRKLAEELLVDPAQVAVAPAATAAETVEQAVFYVDKPQKIALLTALLQRPEVTQSLVFTRTKHGADKVVRILTRSGITAAAIHGNKSQGARTRALEGFRGGSLSVLVASDLASRGLDIDGVSHVVNFDIPSEPETYVHRIGRTGRAGAGGTAWAFCDREEKKWLADIERCMQRRIRSAELPDLKGHPPVAATSPVAAKTKDNSRPTTRSLQPRRPGTQRRPGQRRPPQRGS